MDENTKCMWAAGSVGRPVSIQLSKQFCTSIACDLNRISILAVA